MFKELAKSIELEKEIIIPKIKGHTKIELTDVNTGKKEIVESDNTFQSSVVASYMRSLGLFNNNPFNNGDWNGRDILRNFAGGIFCFSDTIAEGKKYMPAGNTMIANGAYQIYNNTTPTELGSFNGVESNIGTDSATLVYDWTTAQGNGEISCVCLTSETGGYIGYGNHSGGSAATKISLIRWQSSQNIGGYIVKDNIAYSFSVNNTAKTVTVTKRRMPISKVSLFDKKVIETLTLSYETALTLTSYQFVYLGGSKIGIIPFQWNNQISNGSTFYFLIYDVSNDTLTEKKIINSTGRTLAVSLDWGLETGMNFGVVGNYAFIFALSSSEYYQTTTTLYKFNITSGQLENTITVNAPRGTADYWTSQTFVPIAPDLYQYGGENNALVIYDSVNETAYPTNGLQNYGQQSSSSAGYKLLMYNEEIDALMQVQDGAAATWAYKNPLFLTTINNLDTPVTKTAAKTMKITYTLTLAE